MSEESKIKNEKQTYKRRAVKAVLLNFFDHLDRSYEIDENFMLKARNTKEQDNE